MHKDEEQEQTSLIRIGRRLMDLLDKDQEQEQTALTREEYGIVALVLRDCMDGDSAELYDPGVFDTLTKFIAAYYPLKDRRWW